MVKDQRKFSKQTKEERGKGKVKAAPKKNKKVEGKAPVADFSSKKTIKKPIVKEKDKQTIKAKEKIEKKSLTQTKSASRKKKAVKVIFLGGVGEIGKNMTALQYGNDIVVVDAGLTFPNMEEMPGIDSVVPDFTYLVQNKDKIKGILITHGHEDHIGGLAYLLKEINPTTPVYGTKLTLMLIDNKLQEHHLQGVNLKVVVPGNRIKCGAFETEFINVNHSISGACALAIRTPVGLIYHSGDFKIDLTPVAGEPIDLQRISQLGEEGVLLYMGESTNIERAGYTMSETVVGVTLDHLFAENTSRRMIIATFASNVHRLQQIIDIAAKYGRKVALSGRSMLNVVDAAMKIGELTIPEGVLIDIDKTKNLFDGELLIISTGSQGEPMSALTRMSMGEYNKVTVGGNDTVIISATPIPGNEKMVYRVINNLYKKGARVVYESLEKIHVSGHACQEEHKILHTLLKPKFFIPVHGEYRHLKKHAELAEKLGMSAHRILITEIGNCVELTEKEMTLVENIPAGARLIDGEGFADGTSEVMKDRIRLSNEGLFSVAIATTGGYIINDPVVEARGYLFAENKCSLPELKEVVKKAVDSIRYYNGDKDELVVCVKKALRNYLYKKSKQSPLIVVSVVEV